MTSPSGTAGLRRYLRPRAPAEPEPERCELCASEVGDDHQHLLDVSGRTLRCACRPCALLFVDRTREVAGTALRTVPDRYLRDPDARLTDEQWDALAIPVGLAFFRVGGGTMTVCYPSPAGATESELDVGGGLEGGPDPGLGDAGRLAAMLEPDVEALLVRREEAAGGGRDRCLLVPVDACYRLVGLVRRYWKGFDGGAEAWAHIDAFFAELDARARDLGPARARTGEPAP